MTKNQKNPHALIYLISIFFILPVFFTPGKTLADSDTGWHIMAGYDILKNLRVPEHNIFSFTTDDYDWLNLSWLWDAGAAKIDALGGLYLLAALAIIIGGITLSCLTWFCLKRGSGTVAAMLAVTFGVFGFMPSLLVRPQQFTNIFTLCFAMVLYFFAKNPAGHKKLFLLPLIMLAWANMHGGFFTGFTILGAYFCQFLWQKQWRALKWLTALGLLTCSAVFINPLGIRIFEGAYRTLGGPMKEFIDEWRSPQDLKDFIYIILFTSIFVFSFKKHSIAEKILCIFWLAQTLIAVRNMTIFMLVSTPVMADGILFIGRRFQIYRDRENDYTHQFTKPFVIKLSIFLAVALPLFFLTPLWQNIIHFSPLSKNYPRAEIDYILDKRPHARLFNHYDYGGYTIYESQGTLKTFIDGRAETAFPPSVVRDYLRFDTAEPGWENLINKYDIDTALMPKELGIQLDYFNKHWHKAYEGPEAIVYFKN